ncbi:hypothetical protein [Novosphingobium sp. JCM 18896]|uniref:hypothetical protein n=1 Tax=Novosphingobium sp. JCM 18896 TaxID=2989731 RepID=UPI0022219722|nr:hypothetical protein [Novosphingobium sp. JCM 18896]MCW1429860.1 hypothetical protein [Novosphingobium sp. JCM 18896]
MSATLTLAGLLLAQSAWFVAPTNIERTDVAYEAMSHGRTDAAISQLRDHSANDAAALINLGTAYARKGMRAEAMECFEAAMAADRYELQLADGSWMDSRRAARIAAARLDRTSTLASR